MNRFVTSFTSFILKGAIVLMLLYGAVLIWGNIAIQIVEPVELLADNSRRICFAIVKIGGCFLLCVAIYKVFIESPVSNNAENDDEWMV
jgi:hypothetical protein